MIRTEIAERHALAAGETPSPTALSAAELRAVAVLLAGQGIEDHEIAARLEVRVDTARRWIARAPDPA